MCHSIPNMKANFVIDTGFAVKLDGIHIDLHNNYEFKSIQEREKRVLVEFVKVNGDWVHENEFKKLVFIHKNVSYKYFEKGDNSAFPDDENILSWISFFPQTMRDINNGFMEQTKPKEKDDVLFLFENGKVFRIGCDEIELKAER